MQRLEQIIDRAFDNRAKGFEDKASVAAAVEDAIQLLDSGEARVAEPKENG